MIAFPNAKINIGLQVVSLRPDGFRNLESCFYPVNWCDALEIIPATETHFTSSGILIPGEVKDNLCLKAYELIRQDFDLKPVHIHLHKNIPIGAGMGGGSSDAAFTLKILNDLFELNLKSYQLEEYARMLGSDCAFFIQNKPVYAVEKGDIFKSISLDLTGYTCAIVYPNLHITTAEAYRNVVPQTPSHHLLNLLQSPITNWRNKVQNDFEQALFPKYPELAIIKERMYQAGAIYASMTGSGSAVYGLFPEELNPELAMAGASYTVWHGTL